MTILLTGGTGFVGINIAEKLLDENMEVVLYSLAPLLTEAEDSFKSLKGKYTYVKGDILNEELLDSTIKKYNITTVVHTAAITPDENREMKCTKKIIDVNCIGTVNILEAVKRNNIEKMIYLSSITAYGKTAFEDKSLKEDVSILQPNTLYGITKFTAERIAIRYKELQGINVTIVRIGHVFGPWEHYTGVRDLLSPLYQATRLAILGKKALLTRPGDRSWVYSRDVSGAINALIKCKSLRHDVYNIGSGKVWSVEAWCSLLSAKYPEFSYSLTEKDEEGNINFHYKNDHAPLEIDRLKEDVNYFPQYNISKSFEDYTNWISRNSDFWIRKNN